MRDKPPAEHDVDLDLARGLLEAQHPDLADLPLAKVGEGWDNLIVRVGDELAMRLPRRGIAAALVPNEIRWLPRLAPRLPLPVPTPLRTGSPGLGYPWPWTVVPWFPGRPAVLEPPTDPFGAARTLGRFVAALGHPAPTDAPVNPARGVPLGARDGMTRRWLDQLAGSGDVDIDLVARRWAGAVALPAHDGLPVWLHGDLHPANVIVCKGRISAIVDFGDITAGDPATDLGIAWMMLSAPARAVFREEVGKVDDVTWARGRGWALAIALALLANGAGDAGLAQVGRTTLAEVLSEDP